jgi:hypothetical protein
VSGMARLIPGGAQTVSRASVQSVAMLRRSISCMCAGLLMAAAGDFFVVCAATGWMPHKIVVASAIALGITGWIWLWDELP